MKTNANRIEDLAFLTKKPGKQNWILDSGSISHIANKKELFSIINNNDKSTVIIANGNKLKAYDSEEAVIKTKTPDGDTKRVTLKEVLCAPE